MDTLVKGQSSLYLVPEVAEGTYVAETVAAEGIEPLEDGLEFNLEVQEIERSTLTGTTEDPESRQGRTTVTGAIPMEFKAGSVFGSEPRGGLLYESLMGGKRSAASTTVTGAGNTASVLKISDSAIAKFNIGDCILVKKAGAFEVRPIASKVSTPGSATITLAIPLTSAPPDGVVIEKFTTYHHASTSPSFSASYYAGGAIKEAISGAKALSASLEGWTASETPSINFSIEGLDIVKAPGSPSVIVDFSGDAKVPVIHNACAWLGIDKVDYSEFGLSIENSKADIPNACSSTGKSGNRKTGFTVSGSINPYMEIDNVDRWTKFRNGTVTSLFTYAYNPTGVAGEFNQVVAIWMPNIKISSMPQADQDGVLVDSIEFKAFRSLGNDTLFMSFI